RRLAGNRVSTRDVRQLRAVDGHGNRPAPIEARVVGVGRVAARGRPRLGSERTADEVETEGGAAGAREDREQLALGRVVLVAKNVVRPGSVVGHADDLVAAGLELLDTRDVVDTDVDVNRGQLAGVAAPPVLDGRKVHRLLGDASGHLPGAAADVGRDVLGPVVVTAPGGDCLLVQHFAGRGHGELAQPITGRRVERRLERVSVWRAQTGNGGRLATLDIAGALERL